MRQFLSVTFALTIAACTLSAQSQVQRSTPEPPEGYAWKVLGDINASFLVPEGWFFRSEQKGATFGYFITREEIVDGGEFRTGLTMNVVKQLTRATGMEASKYAYEFVGIMTQQGADSVFFLHDFKRGIYSGREAQIRAKRPEGGETIIHVTAFGNTVTDTLYIILFESDEATWDAMWPTGKTILDAFAIDDNV